MIKGLLYLDENLAASIALRYASHLAELINLQLQTTHVEQPDQKQHSAGSGWVRRTWEKGLQDAGAQVVQRLLKTENVQCPFISPPRILIGDRDDEILAELRAGSYDLFMEGDLNTSNVNDFYKLINSRLYVKSPCPVLIVKNLVAQNKAVLLCGDGVDHKKLIDQFLKIFGKAGLDLEILYYKFQETDELVFNEKEAAGIFLQEAENLLRDQGNAPTKTRVVTGTPEMVGDYLGNYSLVASTFPTRKSPRMETLAHTPSPVLLCK
jgi:hypothetical protein